MDYIEKLSEKLISFSDKSKADWLKNYMKNDFEFTGINPGLRKKIFSEHKKKYGLPELNREMLINFWKNPLRDIQYAAIWFYRPKADEFNPNNIDLLEFMLTQKPWWDTVDLIAPTIVRTVFDNYPEKKCHIINKWLNSKNIWLRRSCIIFQLRKKDKTDFELLKNIILQTYTDNNLFIQRAIGWALREYSKTNLKDVINFLDENSFSNLIKRESLEYAQRKGFIGD